MFIEFQTYNPSKKAIFKAIFNISRIDCIREENKRAVVYIGGIEYRLKESYDEVKGRLNNILCNC